MRGAALGGGGGRPRDVGGQWRWGTDSVWLCNVTHPLWAPAIEISGDLGKRGGHLVLSPPDAVVKDTQPEDRQLASQVSSLCS